MDALNKKRARLRDELRQAYNTWSLVGSSDIAKQQWFDYLAAKDRLVLAYAEQPPAA